MIKKELYFDKLVLPESVEVVREGRLKGFVKPRPALLVLDMQSYFVEQKSHAWVPEARDLAVKTDTLKKVFQNRGYPVIFTRHLNNNENAANMGIWWRDFIKREDPLSHLSPYIETKGAPVVEKSQYDAFFNTELDSILKTEGVNSLFIAGVMTQLCCETTARSAFVRGYQVYFGIDFTATYNMDFHNSTLINISHGFGVPLYFNEVEDLLGESGIE